MFSANMSYFKVLALAVLMVVVGQAAFAQIAPFPTNPIPSINPSLASGGQVILIVQKVVGFFGFLLGALAILALFISGFFFMTAGDDTGRLTKAKGWLKWGIIGVVVALFASVVVPLVMNIITGNF